MTEISITVLDVFVILTRGLMAKLIWPRKESPVFVSTQKTRWARVALHVFKERRLNRDHSRREYVWNRCCRV